MRVSDSARIYLARSLRGCGDGCAAILIPLHLAAVGYGADAIGAISSAMMIGSAAMLAGFGLLGHQISLRTSLLAGCVLVILTGFNFAVLSGVAALVLAALIGTVNPTGGDNNIFRPLEQTALSESLPETRHTSAFAIYSFLGFLAAGVGASMAGLPDLLAERFDRTSVFQCMMGVYALSGLIGLLLYRRLSVGAGRAAHAKTRLRKPSRKLVAMTALFSIDALGGGFTLNAVLTLWLLQRFEIAASDAAALFFTTGICSAVSLLAAPIITRRLGIVPSMVGSQLVACALVIATALAPTLPLAATFLVLRSFANQIDGPARTTFVLAAVPREDRAAAASLTTLPFLMTAAVGPIVAGILLQQGFTDVPLLLGAGIKIVFNIAFVAWIVRARHFGI